MKRPPDRKTMLAAAILLVAAGMLLSQPGLTTHAASPNVALAKLFGRS